MRITRGSFFAVMKVPMKKPYRSHDEATAEMFRKDPAFAAEYLNAVLEDGDQAEVLVALRHIFSIGQ